MPLWTPAGPPGRVVYKLIMQSHVWAGADIEFDVSDARYSDHIKWITQEGEVVDLVGFHNPARNLLVIETMGLQSSCSGIEIYAHGPALDLDPTTAFLQYSDTGFTFEAQNTGDALFTVNNLKLHIYTPTIPLADAQLQNGHFTAYLDTANNQLVFKVKYPNGTIKSGAIPLT